MKLQLNDSGAWKQVLNFQEAHLGKVQAAACQLVAIVGTAKLRILQDDGVTVYAYCDKPALGMWAVK